MRNGYRRSSAPRSRIERLLARLAATPKTKASPRCHVDVVDDIQVSLDPDGS